MISLDISNSSNNNNDNNNISNNNNNKRSLKLSDKCYRIKHANPLWLHLLHGNYEETVLESQMTRKDAKNSYKLLIL